MNEKIKKSLKEVKDKLDKTLGVETKKSLEKWFKNKLKKETKENKIKEKMIDKITNLDLVVFSGEDFYVVDELIILKKDGMPFNPEINPEQLERLNEKLFIDIDIISTVIFYYSNGRVQITHTGEKGVVTQIGKGKIKAYLNCIKQHILNIK